MFINSMLAYIPMLFTNKENSQDTIQSSYKSELEKYIISKNPQTVYDVDYWTTQYDRKQARRNWLSWLKKFYMLFGLF